MPRATRIRVHSLADVAQRCREHLIAGLVLDVEPFVAQWGCTDEEFCSGVDRACRQLRAAIPSLRSLTVATNSHRQWRRAVDLTEVGFVRRAWKPWRAARFRDAPRPLAVVGDTVVTDGLLAVRLDALYLQFLPDGRMPLWPRVQSWGGHLLAPMLFDELPSETRPSDRGAW